MKRLIRERDEFPRRLLHLTRWVNLTQQDGPPRQINCPPGGGKSPHAIGAQSTLGSITLPSSASLRSCSGNDNLKSTVAILTSFCQYNRYTSPRLAMKSGLRARQRYRILIASGKDFEEVLFFQCGLELFGTDAAFGSFLLFEQVEGNMTKYG